MRHKICGENYHGEYALALQGPAQGFILSPGQARKYQQTLCGHEGCKCGGCYGAGPDPNSATVELVDWEAYRLIPAGE